MKGALVFAALLSLVGPCSKGSDDSSGGTAPATTTAAATATATAAATTPAATVAVTATPKTPSHPTTPTTATPPAQGPCAALAQKCAKCPTGAVQIACNSALAAGALDPNACTNALADKDISSQCGASAPPTPPPTVNPTPTPSGGNPCADLAKKCTKCPAGAVQMACNGALTAGSLDPRACTNALNDANIKSQCN
jgi:hypothetical protein